LKRATGYLQLALDFNMDHSHLRAADADRKRILAVLERHFVDGRLTSDEYGERVSQALAARTFGQLDELLQDLPRLEPGPPLERAEPAEPRADLWDQADFRRHALSYLLVMALLVVIWLITSPGGYFWPIWPMLGWGIGLAAHALSRTNWGGRRHRPRDR
jgi:hypothetical protein